MRQLLNQAIEEASDEEGWAQLGAVGSYLNKLRSDFDPRLYGHRKLSDLFKAYPKWFEFKELASQAGGKDLYVRAK